MNIKDDLRVNHYLFLSSQPINESEIIMVSFPKILKNCKSLGRKICLFSFLWEFNLKQQKSDIWLRNSTIEKGDVASRTESQKTHDNNFVELVFRQLNVIHMLQN